jgi:hypothetical protein
MASHERSAARPHEAGAQSRASGDRSLAVRSAGCQGVRGCATARRAASRCPAKCARRSHGWSKRPAPAAARTRPRCWPRFQLPNTRTTAERAGHEAVAGVALGPSAGRDAPRARTTRTSRASRPGDRRRPRATATLGIRAPALERRHHVAPRSTKCSRFPTIGTASSAEHPRYRGGVADSPGRAATELLEESQHGAALQRSDQEPAPGCDRPGTTDHAPRSALGRPADSCRIRRMWPIRTETDERPGLTGETGRSFTAPAPAFRVSNK